MFKAEIRTLQIPDAKVIKFARFRDLRGYFTENYRKSDLVNLGLDEFKSLDIVQMNESFSFKGTVRGLHFQWNPVMNKLIRPAYGSFLAVGVDIRKGSPTQGRAFAVKMSSSITDDTAELLYVPEGFAAGFLTLEDTLVQYLITGMYNGECEASISPIAKDIDWNLVEDGLRKEFLEAAKTTELISEKDKDAMSLEQWFEDERSDNFIYNG